MEDKSRDIKILDDITHVLHRPNTYIGATEPSEKEEWVLDDEGLLKRSKLTYSEALLKIINEIIDNSLDEYVKTDGKFSNKIDIDVKDDRITVTDNGRGLPIKKTDDGTWMPIAAFTKLRAGSNFNDDDRKGIGTNGIGSSATNIFSKLFEVTTTDGSKKFKMTCRDNLSSERHSVVSFDCKPGTKVTFIPDYERFSCKHLPKEIEVLLKTRLRMLSWFFPKCAFSYNGEKMNIKAKDMESMFPSPSVSFNSDKVYALAYSTEEPEFLSYVNGLSLRRGGTHIDYILNSVVNSIREKVSKKCKSIKPSDIKNRLGIVVLFKDFPSCQFDSQTKEYLSNSEKDIKAYLDGLDIDGKFIQKVAREKTILDNITEIFQLKENLKEKKELQKMNVKKKDIDSDKFFPAIGEKKYLCITEGQSAFGGISPVLGRRGISYYQIKGKILNTQNLSIKKAMANEEINDLVNILGIDISDPNTDITYDKIVITSDADPDGSHIAALICSLFNKLCPKMVKEGRLCRLNTPLLVGTKGKEVVKYYFTLPDQSELDPKLKWRYQKGLGGWGGENKALLQQIMDKEGGLEGLLLTLTQDDCASESLEHWMGDSANYRKQSLRGREFHIGMM